MPIWTQVITNHYATVGEYILADTTASSFVVYLPSSPTTGDQVYISDGADFSVNSLTVDVNGLTLEGSETNLVLNQKGVQISFVYNGLTWKRYNVVIPQVKISELFEVSNEDVSGNDLLLFINSETSESNKIKLSTLGSSITANTYKTVGQIVTDLNAYTAANTSPKLNVTSFNGQASSYYRNYNNLTNKPTIPTRTSDLINDGSVLNGSPYITNLNSFNTNQLTEGSTNWYFTNARFDTRFDTRFPELFRLYSNELQEARLTDSEYNIPAAALTTATATNTIVLTSQNLAKFKVGENIRIFGASSDNASITAVPTFVAVTKNGLTGTAGNTVKYRLVHFSLNDGKLSTGSASSVTIELGTKTLTDFNLNNNIRIEFNRTSASYGILVYRSYNNSSFTLIDVLGPKQLGVSKISNIVYYDYAGYNSNTWTNKTATGEYTSQTGLIHIPITAPTTASKGWVDAEIASIDTTQNRIVLVDSYYLNSTVSISHNDTAIVQSAINERVAAGIKSLTLNDRRYIVSSITLPGSGNFTVYGKGHQTVLFKMPWAAESHNRIIYASGVDVKNIGLSNFDIDGNMANQALDYDEGSEKDANYAISISGSDINIDKIHVMNVVGGGIYSPQPTKIAVDSCRFEDSGMSDLYAYSPLYMPEGNDVMVTHNVFKNFSDSVDISTTYNGIFSGNIVENTGSGVLTYGSRFFVNSANIIKGPAGEFISGPDTLNSEYDSVNIVLEANTSFTSPAFLYQENGSAFNLTANEGAISYKLNKLGKFNNVEELYGTLPDLISDVVGPNKAAGEFQFSISKQNVETLMSTYSFSNMYTANTGHVGIVYRAIQTEQVPSGTVINTPTINPDGLGNDKYRVTLINYSNLAVGRTIKFAGHGGVIGSGTLDNTEGVILSILENTTPNPSQAYVTIDYSSSVSEAGSGGVLKIKNEFVLAKGKVQ